MNTLEILSKIMERYKNVDINTNKKMLNSILYENELMILVIKNPESHPKYYLSQMNMHNYDIDIFDTLTKAFSKNPIARKELVEDSKEIANMLYKFCFYDNIDEKFYIDLKKKVFKFSKRKMRDKMILNFFLKEIKMVYHIDYIKYLDNLGYRMSTHCLADIVDCKAEEMGLKSKHDVKGKVSDIKEELKTFLDENCIDSIQNIDEVKAYVSDLRNSLELVEDQLTNYQNELESYREEVQLNVISDFIQTLNSEKYGNLLDNFMKCQKKLRVLKKEGYEFPDSVESIPIVIRQFVKFIEEYGITKIQKEENLELNYNQALNSQYIGTPFKDENEKKYVAVESSGWKYKDIVISIPKYVEQKLEE